MEELEKQHEAKHEEAAALQAEHWEKRLALAAKFRSELLATNALISNPRLRISPD